MSADVADELSEEVLLLGEQRSVHRTNRVFALSFGILLVVVGMVMLLPGVLLAISPNPGDAEVGWFLVSYAFPTATLGLFLGWWWWVGRDRGVVLFTNGVAVLRAEGVRVIPFANILAVWYEIQRVDVHGVPVTLSHTYTLDLRDGERVKVTGVERTEYLGGEILSATAELLVPTLAAAWVSGQTVEFGPLHFREDGIRHGRNLLRWPEVHTVQVSEGAVQVQKAGAWFNWASVPVASVPNFHLIVPLAKIVFATLEAQRAADRERLGEAEVDEREA